MAFALHKQGHRQPPWPPDRLHGFGADGADSGYLFELGAGVVGERACSAAAGARHCRSSTSRRLWSIGDQTTIAALTPLKDDPDRDVASAATHAIERIRMTQNRRDPAARVLCAPDAFEVAKDLIGKVLVHETRSGVAAGVIVEAEAYVGESDPACHACRDIPRATRRSTGLPASPTCILHYMHTW